MSLCTRVLEFGIEVVEKSDARKGSKTYAKPGRSVGINLSNYTEDYNSVDIGTEHRLSFQPAFDITAPKDRFAGARTN
jgi:hypothetical protein